MKFKLNVEAEKKMLGFLMLNGKIDTNKITIDLFASDTHKKIFKKMMKRLDSGLPIDLMSLTPALPDISVSYLTSLINDIPNDIENIYKELKEQKSLRKLSKIQENLENLLETGTPSNEISKTISKSFYELSIVNGGIKHDTMRAMLPNILKDIEEAQLNGEIKSLKSGLMDFDKLTGGFQDGKLYVIAARPAMGKSALMLNMATNIVKKYDDKIVGIFSFETTPKDFGFRMLSTQSLIPLGKLKSGNFDKEDWKKVSAASSILNKQRINIINASGFTIDKVYDKVLEMKASFGIDILFLDYLQLISFGKKSALEAVSEASKVCKEIAMKVNIPVVMLSQLSRAVEMRNIKRPMLSDLRESGQIEQDADLVIFIYRDEYYHPKEENKNLAELIIAKHRDGATGTLNFYFNKKIMKFGDLANEHRK